MSAKLKTVLIVDEDAATRLRAIARLERHYRVLSAVSGEAAVAMLTQEEPDLLAGGDDGGLPGGQLVQVGLASRAGRQVGLLLAQDLQHGRRHCAPRGKTGALDARHRVAEARREERMCSRLTCEVGIGKCAAHC